MAAKRRDMTPAVGDISELEPCHQELALRCVACGKSGKYDVGSIFLDPQILKDKKTTRYEDAFSFTGYFRCSRCHSSGPWEFPAATQSYLLSTALAAAEDPDKHGFYLGAIALFDGTISPSPARAEDYIRTLLDEHPDDFFLHNRLGNILDKSGFHRDAREEFECAVTLNPEDIGSQYQLACLKLQEDRIQEALSCFQQVLQHAPRAHYLQDHERRRIVGETLDQLLRMDAINAVLSEIQPQTQSEAKARSREPAIVYMSDFELTQEADWERLVDMFCFDPQQPSGRLSKIFNSVKKWARSSRSGFKMENEWEFDPTLDEADFVEDFEENKLFQVTAPLQRESSKVSRNEPCPCGSGKKYKRCCGKT